MAPAHPELHQPSIKAGHSDLDSSSGLSTQRVLAVFPRWSPVGAGIAAVETPQLIEAGGLLFVTIETWAPNIPVGQTWLTRRRFWESPRPGWLAKPNKSLLRAVCLHVLLRRVLRVLGGKNMVPVCQVRVVGSFLMVASCVMLGCFVVVARRVLKMFRCLRVVMRCFF